MDMTIPERLIKARGTRTQKSVAEATGIPYSTFRAYEKGERRPSDKRKVILASFYGLSVQELFYNQECHKW